MASEVAEAGLIWPISLRGSPKSAMQNVQTFNKTSASMASEAAKAGLAYAHIFKDFQTLCFLSKMKLPLHRCLCFETFFWLVSLYTIH